MLEVCIDSLESALNAVHGSADELEVCSSLVEGGLTPTVGLVKEILNMVNRIGSGAPVYRTCPSNCDCLKLTQKTKVNVMVRCRPGSDFCYTETEMDTMLADIEAFKQMKVDRIVFGALNRTQSIDVDNCKLIVSNSYPIPVTFHRAFDIIKDPMNSITMIIELGFDRILTSGQRIVADDLEAIKLIEKMQTSFGNKIDIMPGAGVNSKNAKILYDLGCKIVHSSCKRVRVLPKTENNLNMGTGDSEFLYVTDVESVKEIKAIK